MASPKPESIGPATLAISQSVVAFTAFLPNFTEIGRSDKSAIEGEVRLGEIAAVFVAGGIGVLLSWLTGSNVPLVVSLLVSLLLVTMYETALRKEV